MHKDKRSKKSIRKVVVPVGREVDGDEESSTICDQDGDAEREERDCSAPIGTVFDIDEVDDPLVGAPSEVQSDLDALALKVQRRPSDQKSFMRIVAYMHKYLVGLVFKKYPFVRGYEESDMYQEALIALMRKAIPAFRLGKNMSFLNFAKMCVNRHLITILNSANNGRKHMPINTAISLDHSPSGAEDDDSCLLSNVITGPDRQTMPFDSMERSEAFAVTFRTLSSQLSRFEKCVLVEYLQEESYRDSARKIRRKHGARCNEKSIDNALLRIRKKAAQIKAEMQVEMQGEALPLLGQISIEADTAPCL